MTSKSGLWKHFKKSIGKPCYVDPKTEFEFYPVWIFWCLGGSAVWWTLTGIFG